MVPALRATIGACVLLAGLGCSPAAPEAKVQRLKPVHISSRYATFAVGDLAGRTVISARLTAHGRKSRRVKNASVRRAAGRSRQRLLVLLPRSWRPARRARRLGIRLRVRAGGCADPVAPQSSAGVLWKADAESALVDEWASNSSVPAAVSPAKPDPRRIAQQSFRTQGKRSYRVELRDGDMSFGERAELAQGLPATAAFENRWFRAGAERWIAMQYYLPSSWPHTRTWQTIFQIKPIGPGGGGPNIGLDAGSDGLKFYGNSNVWGSTKGAYHDGAGPQAGGAYPLTRGRWIKLTWHVVFSADPAVGSLEVFGNLADGAGMRVLVPRRARPTMKYRGATMDPVHLRVGIYRDPAMTSTQHLFVDGVTVARTREAAEDNAYALTGC